MVRYETTDFRLARDWRLPVLIFIAVALVLVGRVVRAQTASALVLARSGISTPEIRPYTEIPVGTTISLSPGARLVFQHYRTCRTVTVVGGKVRFGNEIYTITGGTKERETKTPCPRTVTLKVGGESGGILMRGPGLVTLPSQPAFVLVGRRACDFSSVRVSKGGTVLLEASLVSRSFKWPTDAEPLDTGTGYELALIPAMGSGKPIAMKFRVAASGLGKEGLLLIRVE